MHVPGLLVGEGQTRRERLLLPPTGSAAAFGMSGNHCQD